jgi:hypothetical protein
MKYLNIFNKYSNELDEAFDDNLIIEYKYIKKPIFKIVYDPSVDLIQLDKSIPKEWKELEKNNEIILDIHMYGDNKYKINNILNTPKIKKITQKLDNLLDNL